MILEISLVVGFVIIVGIIIYFARKALNENKNKKIYK